MDDTGNRLLTTEKKPSESDLLVSYYPNELNQYQKVGDNNQKHDGNGNLIDDGTRVMWYDFANRLVGANKGEDPPQTEDLHTYKWRYDALGRRVRIDHVLYPAGGAPAMFYLEFHWYDGGHQAISDRCQEPPKCYVYGIGIDEVLMMYTSWDTKRYYHYNQLGSVTALTEASGDVSLRCEYDAYGAPRAYDADGDEVEVVVHGPVGNPFLFTGRRWEPFGLGLYDYRARHYDPATGRFLQRDPAENLNPYTYVNNRPVFYIDPHGVQAIPGDIAPGPKEIGTYPGDKEAQNRAAAARFNREFNTTAKTIQASCPLYNWSGVGIFSSGMLFFIGYGSWTGIVRNVTTEERCFIVVRCLYLGGGLGGYIGAEAGIEFKGPKEGKYLAGSGWSAFASGAGIVAGGNISVSGEGTARVGVSAGYCVGLFLAGGAQWCNTEVKWCKRLGCYQIFDEPETKVK
jgi:RHS repeat-associated protein